MAIKKTYLSLSEELDPRIIPIIAAIDGVTQMIKAILFDVSGVLHVDGEPVSGAVEALCRVRRAGFAIRYVTNTSRQTSQETLQSLIKMGFEANPSEVFTAAAVLKQVLQQRCLRPYCLIHHEIGRA